MSFLRMQESKIIRNSTFFAEIPAFAGMTKLENIQNRLVHLIKNILAN
jgi:hypothetical protein